MRTPCFCIKKFSSHQSIHQQIDFAAGTRDIFLSIFQLKIFMMSDITYSFKTWLYLIQWIIVSNMMILLNKVILSGWKFSYPFFLTACHMFFAMIITQILSRTTNMLPGTTQKKVTWNVYKNNLLPMAILFSVSIMTGNKAYLFLSVSYIQVMIILLQFLFGISNHIACLYIACFY